MNWLHRCWMAIVLVFGVLSLMLSPAYAQTDPAELAKAVEAIEHLDAI